MAKVFMVDDEPLLMESLEIILTYSGGHLISGSSNNGVEALDKLSGMSEEQLPDVMLVDLNMPQMGGIELIKIVHEKYPKIKIIVLTTFYDEKNISQALAGGATGYLLKDSGKEAILDAIDRALNGQSVLDGKVMEKITQMMAGAASEENKKAPAGDIYEGKDLTDREKEICRLIAEGCTNSQIASILFISEGTVKNYMSSIYDKFDVHDRAKLALMLKG
jgi:DNA-binding NarL/FixJ family response regulator